MEKFDTDSSLLHPILTECRVIKSELELALIQYANDVSSEAHSGTKCSSEYWKS
jgi:Xaa-Pro dipeptidase